MLQIITAIMKDPEDKTECHLLFANQVGFMNHNHVFAVYFYIYICAFVHTVVKNALRLPLVYRLRKTSCCGRSWKSLRSDTQTGSSCGSLLTEHLRVSPRTIFTYELEPFAFFPRLLYSFSMHQDIHSVYVRDRPGCVCVAVRMLRLVQVSDTHALL